MRHFVLAAEAAPSESEIDNAVVALTQYDEGLSRKPLLALEALIRRTHGNAALRAREVGQVANLPARVGNPRHQLERALAKVLDSAASRAAKQFVSTQLWSIGTDLSVPALARMLSNADTAEMACFALATNPSPQAAGALREALPQASGSALVALVNLVGERRDAASDAAIARLAGHADRAIAEAAIAALGKLATDPAIELLAKLRRADDAQHRRAAQIASLQCAQELARRGKTPAARTIYEELAASGEPEHVRRGAQLALARPSPTQQAPTDGMDLSPIQAVRLFDGKSFEGWEGNLDWFRIESGAIVAGSLEKNIPRNEFLSTREEFADFELRLQVKLLGDPARANAGIQFRSRRIPDHHEMIGYQADMGQDYWGKLYDESRRRKVLAGVEFEQLRPHLKLADWNDYVIRAVGHRIQLWINGFPTVDYTEPDDAIERTGLIAVQIHSGPPSEARYRSIVIKPAPK